MRPGPFRKGLAVRPEEKCTQIEMSFRLWKVAGMAVADLAAVWILAYSIHVTRGAPLPETLAALLALGVVTHKILGINTQLNFYLGLNPRVR